MSSSSFTTIICTHNRAPLLQHCLDALAHSMGGRDHPVLVIDNGSVDDTPSIVETFSDRLNLRYVIETTVGLSYARNRALSECTTKYIVYLDDDAKPDPGWVDAIEDGIATWNPDFFGGPYRPFYLKEKPSWFEDVFGSQYTDRPERALIPGEHISGGNMGWRTSLLKAIGGFPTSLGMVGNKLGLGEETYLVNLMHREYPERRGVSLPDMSMQHLVTENKFSLHYWARRAWQYGQQLPVIDPEEGYVGWVRALRETPFFLRLAWRLIVRDRKKYPYWHTYAMHCIGRSVVVFGAFFSPYRSAEIDVDLSEATRTPVVYRAVSDS